MNVRGLSVALAAGLTLWICGVEPAQAIDRDCPKGQTWDPNQGSCVKKKVVQRRSPARKYYEAIEHIEGTGKRPRPERGVKLLEEACKSKHAPSCTLLGFLHLNARAVPFNAIRSLEFYEKACTYKDPNGCLGAAEIHSRGLINKIDHPKAVAFLDSACKLDSGKGCYELALKWDSGLGVTQNANTAKLLFRRAFNLLEPDCNANAGPSCYLTGESYFKGRGVARNYTKSLAAFQRGCASGSGQACYWLGVSYRWGYGTEKDEGKALDSFDRACRQYDNADGCHDRGVVIAQSAPATSRSPDENKRLMELGERACDLDKRTCDLLAYLYATGKAGIANEELATRWYLVGCDHGSSAACQSAAHRAFEGTGMTKDVPRALTMWQQACDLNWKEACADLGEHYFQGKVVTKDLKKAYSLFNTGCTRGDMDACHWVAWVKHKGQTGYGGPDPKGAVYYYKKACDELSGACIDLGHLYKDGVDKLLEKDPDEAKLWYDKACDKGHKKGCTSLGDMHFRGEGVPKDPLKAALAYQRACKLGATQECYFIDNLLRNARANAVQKKNALAALEDACTDGDRNDDACVELARLYAWGGYIADKNGRRAFQLYDETCKRNVKMACVQLGHMYTNGIGVVKDTEKAKQLFTQQCNGAIPAACAWLGVRLYEEKKYDEAAPLFRKACDDGDLSGCTMIGYAHYTARGVPWDLAATKKAYEKGCELGEAASCSNLGEMYEYGIGTNIDLKKARELYQQGCTPNAASGCSNLARFHENGIEGDADPKEAEALYIRGCEEAQWGQACLELAAFLAKSGTAKRSRIAALQQRGVDLVKDNAKDNPYSTYLLGKLYRDGITMVKDPVKATEAFLASCAGYDPLGCLEAGTMLMGGKGVDADYEKAALQFDRACGAGLEDACEQAEVARATKPGGGDTNTDPKVPLPVNKKSSCACDGSGDPVGGTLVLLAAAALLATRRRRSC